MNMNYTGYLYWCVELPNAPIEQDEWNSEGASAIVQVEFLHGMPIAKTVYKTSHDLGIELGGDVFESLASYAGWDSYKDFLKDFEEFLDDNFSDC